MKYLRLITLTLVCIVCSFTAFSQLKKTTKTTKPKTKETVALIKTSFGNIKIKLYNETPLHRDNFIKLVNKKFYNGILFHRVISSFMIQCGDPLSVNAAKGTELGSGGTGYTIPAELNKKLFHKKGALAAARLGDQVNQLKESSGSQFYIVVGEKWNDSKLDDLESKMTIKFSPEQRNAYKTVGGTPHLDMGYTVFGEVIEGMEVVDKIVVVKTDKRSRPLDDVKIISISIIN